MSDTLPTLNPTDPAWLFFDPTAWGDMGRWHQIAGDLRRREPVVRTEVPGNDPVWILTRHGDVLAVERDPERWVNTARSNLMPNEVWNQLLGSGMPLPASLVHLDGEKHRAHRQVTNDWFKPAVVGNRQERIDEIADSMIERMRELGGECDFATDIANPYTLHVIMDIYGVPEEDEPMMLELTQGLFGSADPEFVGEGGDPTAKVLEVAMQFLDYFGKVNADRIENPRNDLATVIANGQVDGCPMGEIERFWYYVIVATAGHDTTSYSLSGGLEAMLRDPDQFWALRDDPSLIVTAADEMIRWTAPVRHFLRYATQDSEIQGVSIPEGGTVLLSYPSANRDEAVFDTPDEFSVHRKDADKLLSFGVGIHFCLGAQFARRELRTMLSKLSTSLATIELAGEPSWSQSNFVSGVKHLPIRYSFK